MDTGQILDALNDPKRNEEMVKELMDNVHTIEDENGNKHKLFSLGGLFLDANKFCKQSTSMRNTKNFSLRDDDIILAACPKTGSHWLSNLLTFLVADGPLANIPTVQVRNLDGGQEKDLEAVPRPRVLQTHMKPELLPNGYDRKGRKIVLVFRNPKDTAVSLYHFIKTESMGWDALNVSWRRYVQHWMKEGWLYFNFFDYYNEWQRFIQDNNDVSVHIVYFEDMRKNGLEELRRLQKYLGLNHSDERLQQVLEKSSLKNLKTEVLERKSVSPFFIDGIHTHLYRKGEIGDWKNYFTVAESEQMDAVIAEKFKGSIFKEHAVQ